jgi:NAD(P)-dependent dehydrogenase (short-subunit alcohol dehydrogenase family)
MTPRIVSAFGWQSTADEVAQDHDLVGQTVVVTGAATGIGFETAKALALSGADVVIAARNRALAESAVDNINQAVRTSRGDGGPNAQFDDLDLASLASVRDFAVRWGSRQLDVLINNAGVMACPFARTVDGFEMQLGTNHFGHFLLANMLVPALLRGAERRGCPARVVSLSSIGHRRSGILWDDPNYGSQPYDRWEAYGQSKTANALFALGFNQTFGRLGIHANAVMPGGIMTPLQRHMAHEEMVAMGWINTETGQPREGFKTPAQGAATSVWAAVGRELEGIGGLYLEECQQALPWSKSAPWVGVAPHAIDPEAAQRLWSLSTQAVA